ncbi:hypothetical protein JKP88DRAFT_259972 [Tribonema minus]|uniref:EGF-like domain-containing protein n=1 Tax=Tribonema minus TaxID=303371 RepID=A0A835Z8A8_9STRA|nr:hypothetical protein JKP88DRAFT_259972 [Tribonema minus]
MRRRRQAGLRGCCCGCARLLLVSLLHTTSAWKEWQNNGYTNSSWASLWNKTEGPGGRSGHSLVLFDGGNTVVMFGGRDNDRTRRHVPHTYEVTRVDGTLEFVSYDEKPVIECQEDLINAGNTSSGSCSLEVPVGLYYNDVWAYNLTCKRPDDSDPCPNDGWKLLHEGARLGGCKFYRGLEVCSTPGERWGQGAAAFDDGTMLIYGGYSHRCGDYCDDMWAFDLRRGKYANTWMEIYEPGHFSADTGPGKRWKFSVASDGARMFIFGGHRLWQGFASDNSQDNDWNSTALLPAGGYLSDLWIYTKRQVRPGEPVPTDSSDYGNFTRAAELQDCVVEPGEAWADRSDVTCSLAWPSPRAGHQMVWDAERQGLWVHGGYTTYFPYIDTNGAGSGLGVGTKEGLSEFRPYPDHPFFLSDLWFYDLSSGRWSQIQPASVAPPARMDHSMVKVADALVIMGGYLDNHHYDDTWQFNITTRKWRQRTEFAHAAECVELQWPSDLHRSAKAPWGVLPYAEQDYFYYNGSGATDYGVLTPEQVALAAKERPAEIADGTPQVPYAATGLRQYVRPFSFSPDWAKGKAVTLSERCTSVFGEPTRGKPLDGLNGRASDPVLIAQPRRRAPGWDGCRDRADGNRDLPWQLEWSHPGHRSAAAAVYSESRGQIVMYGGRGYEEERAQSISFTPPTQVLSDMWVLNVNDCPADCSGHGSCTFGNCLCTPGYYGTDCSNSSCPGDYCYFDEDSSQQVCGHCCHAAWEHSNTDMMTIWPAILQIGDVERAQCSRERPGEAHGICDGFGACQCEPPFIGADCSIRDCPQNCSFHGWCSVEFPVSRCACYYGYYGEACQYQECLNNCSYPHGVCNNATGECDCRDVYNPYNNTRRWQQWGGEDCSYLPVFAAAAARAPPLWHWLAVACAAAAVAVGMCAVDARHVRAAL